MKTAAELEAGITNLVNAAKEANLPIVIAIRLSHKTYGQVSGDASTCMGLAAGLSMHAWDQREVLK